MHGFQKIEALVASQDNITQDIAEVRQRITQQEAASLT
jgi:hypothetical protein